MPSGRRESLLPMTQRKWRKIKGGPDEIQSPNSSPRLVPGRLDRDGPAFARLFSEQWRPGSGRRPAPAHALQYVFLGLRSHCLVVDSQEGGEGLGNDGAVETARTLPQEIERVQRPACPTRLQTQRPTLVG